MIIDCYLIDFKQIYTEYFLIMLLDWRIDPSADFNQWFSI